MKLRPETKNNIANTIERTLGVSYEEFEKMDYEEQRKLVEAYRKKHKIKPSSDVLVMIGAGENALFARAKKGEKILVTSGDDSIFVRAGITSEEARQELDDRMDDALYSKPVAFVKKMQRRIKRRSRG